MPTELPDLKTPVSKAAIIEALWRAWGHYFGGYPEHKESIWVLASQWALETGWGASCHNYNLGNAKSRDGDGFDFQFFACNEILPLKQAKSMEASGGGLAKITTVRTDGTAIIWFYPKHPACRFRAFRTLVDGSVDHLHLITNKFRKAWSAVLAGDPAAYAVALKQQGYYTADVSAYLTGLKRCFDAVAKEPFDYDNLPRLTDHEVGRIQNLVSRTQQMLVDDLDLRSRAAFDDD